MTPLLLVCGFGFDLVYGAIVLPHVATSPEAASLAVAFWHQGYTTTSATVAGKGLAGAVSIGCIVAPGQRPSW
jgi:hypothetical protein